MRSMTVWKLADRPNYTTNIDKRFPYSEVPYIGEYALLKIPVSLDDHIHVDYWGEGKVVSEEGIRGFSNCYNVNQQYQLVGGGPDLDRKIPNRIPVVSSNNCDTSGYIKSNSVLIVTVAGGEGYITNSCAKDIARIVNKDHGQVVVYGVDADSEETLELIDELAKNGLSLTWNTILPRELQGLTYYNSHAYFQNTRILKDELYIKIATGEYTSAVRMAINFEAANGIDIINETVTKLISSAPQKLMSFAYKLWHGGAEHIVRNHFPNSFQHIVGEHAVTIVNKQYLQPLKLDVHTDRYNDRLAWGDNSKSLTSERVSWKLLPVWSISEITFKLYNIDCNMYLKLDVTEDSIGDRQAWGSTNSNELRHSYILDPMVKNGTLVFSIINCDYGQLLKLAVGTDSYGDRLLYGHNGSLQNEGERFWWLIEAW